MTSIKPITSESAQLNQNIKKLIKAAKRVDATCYGDTGQWQGFVNLEKRNLLPRACDLHLALKELEKYDLD